MAEIRQKKIPVHTVGVGRTEIPRDVELADVALVVPSEDAQHVEEVQLVLIHLLCELVEEQIMTGRHTQTLALETVRKIWEIPPRRNNKAAAQVPSSKFQVPSSKLS